MQLLESATNRGKYDYYHLLSGLDLPLVSQNEIHDFFDAHQGREFITFSGVGDKDVIYDRVKYHYHLSKITPRMSSNTTIQLGAKAFRKVDKSLQKILRVDDWNRKNSHISLEYGSQWFSITDEFARYVLSKKDWIKLSFEHSYLCDELFLQTLAYNSHFYERIYNSTPVKDIPQEQQGNLRYINWWDGSPYTWNIDEVADINQLNVGIKNGHLFSRKFDLTSEQIKRLNSLRK